MIHLYLAPIHSRSACSSFRKNNFIKELETCYPASTSFTSATIYTADPATLEASAALAASRFHAVMVDKYKSDTSRVRQVASEAMASHSIPVAVPFSSPSEWNAIRSRILSSPGIIGVDVSTLGGDGAVIRLMYVGDLQVVQTSMQGTGLQMSQIGGNWVIQSLL